MYVIVAAIYYIKHWYLHLESTHFIENILYDKGGIEIPDSIEYQFAIWYVFAENLHPCRECFINHPKMNSKNAIMTNINKVTSEYSGLLWHL